MKEEYLEIEESDYVMRQVVGDSERLTNEAVADIVPQQQAPPSLQVQLTKIPFQSIQPTNFDAQCDDAMLRKLLRKFQMDFLYPILKAADVTYRSLRYLSVDDINTAIRSVGYRAEFREKLFTWRRKRYRTNDPIIEVDKQANPPINLEVVDITQSQTTQPPDTAKQPSTPPTIPQPAPINENLIIHAKRRASEANNTLASIPNQVANQTKERENEVKRSKLEDNKVEIKDSHHLELLMNLEKIIDESLFGAAMKHFYEMNGFLERKHRDELIQIIVDYLTNNDIKMHCCDFIKITEMIAKVFPTEEFSKEYYFINRKGKRNPMGRLYTKYYNTLKRLKVRELQQQQLQAQYQYQRSDDMSQESATAATTLALLQQDGDTTTYDDDDTSSQIELVEEETPEIIHLEDSTLSATSALKHFLCSTDLDWDDVKSLWTKTHLSRQEDIQVKTTKEIVEEWPKYLTDRGIDLFDIDFELKYGCKNNILQQKWANFEQKIHNYYQANTKDEVCKNLFTLYKTKPGKDSEDFILTILLNAIVLPTARYRDGGGNRRKISIVDAVDMFAFRLTHLNELEPKRNDILMRYGDLKHSPLGPHIIIVGDGNVTIHEIYVQFHVALYEMPDFLSAIDCCMKIYRVLNIPYPPANEYPWTFIQRYFYELTFDDDAKSPLMSSLLAFLKF